MFYVGLQEDLAAGYFRINFYTLFASLILTYLKSFRTCCPLYFNILSPNTCMDHTLLHSGPRKPLSEAFLMTLASNRKYSSLVLSPVVLNTP